MPKYIIRLPNPDNPSDYRYMHWSTIMDAPVTYGMTREELEAYTLEWEGKNGLRELAERLDRADKYGTSLIRPSSWEYEISGNRAGPGETELDHKALWKKYVDDRHNRLG